MDPPCCSFPSSTVSVAFGEEFQSFSFDAGSVMEKQSSRDMKVMGSKPVVAKSLFTVSCQSIF